MHVAAARERERIGEIVADDAAEHIEKARTRGAIEAAELRRLADDEIREIESWAAREIKHIRHEAGRRSKERRADLASFLQRHDAIIATEIAGVETAVADYAATLAHFVEGLIATADPSEIARRADSVPTPPNLDDARAHARAAAVAVYDRDDDDVAAAGMAMGGSTPDSMGGDMPEAPSDPGVGVMDPEADGRPGELPLAVDPLQVPEDESNAAEEAGTSEGTTGSSDQPTGALRFFRALVPWPAASGTPPANDSEAHRA
jgi:hypothetical protein